MLADVGGRGDRIATVERIAARGARELDATGLAVSPGFIDVHSHDDFTVLLEPLPGRHSRRPCQRHRRRA